MVERRFRNLITLDLWLMLYESLNQLEHVRIRTPSESVSAFLSVPQTNRFCLRSRRTYEHQFIPERRLFPKQRDDFRIDNSREVCSVILVQLHG
jgi:hypothetical protein